MEALQPISSPRLRLGAGARTESARSWAREHLATTPGRLVLLVVLVVTGAVCFGVIASAAERSRERAVEAVRSQTEPLLVQAVNLYTGLADANATATTTFLRGGLEPPTRRAHYLEDLRFASGAAYDSDPRCG